MPTPPTSHENMLGPYRLIRPLGEGGMGSVYLARDEALNRSVAIKVLRSGEKNAESARAAAGRAKRFLREAQAAAGLNHPNVVAIFTASRHAGTPYLVMEFVEGGSLADELRRSGPMPWRNAAQALADALRALAAAHRAGIVHRDIKPANLLLSHDHAGRALVKLADFGLARAYLIEAGDEDLTFPGAFVGSPSYAAPEQIAGIAHIDGRADLYSLAATGHALLTGQPPFVEDDPAEVMERHLRDPFPDVRALCPAAPPEFQAILERAGKKKPADRFASAAEMLDAVEGLLSLQHGLVHGQARPADVAPRASETVFDLESRLALAREKSDSTTQLATLRAFAGLYTQLDRPADAERSYREALAIHIKLSAPAAR